MVLIDDSVASISYAEPRPSTKSEIAKSGHFCISNRVENSGVRCRGKRREKAKRSDRWSHTKTPISPYFSIYLPPMGITTTACLLPTPCYHKTHNISRTMYTIYIWFDPVWTQSVEFCFDTYGFTLKDSVCVNLRAKVASTNVRYLSIFIYSI